MKKRSLPQETIYAHILVPLENSRHDAVILRHIRPLARLAESRITLLHVADGFMARNHERFPESEEMREDTEYLEKCKAELEDDGFIVEAVLEWGEPAKKILAFAKRENCDLIAMATHGHRGLADFVLGSVASIVRHRTDVPVLLVKSSSR